MSSEAERGFHDLLGSMFLHDVGLGVGTPPLVSDEGFLRTAVELELLRPEQVERVLKTCSGTDARRAWQVLEDEGLLDVSEVLRVFHHQGDLEALGGRNVGRYLLVEAIGEGAWGRVYRAIHQDLLKHVALKVLPETPATTRARIERFHREASTAARLGHEHIVGVHDVGVDGRIHYIAMDLIEGQNLDAWAESEDLTRRLAVMVKVARAVGHAHRHGVLHRDLKPANILVRADDQPVLVDFGLARAVDDDRMTADGALLGTPRYMAPEQARGEVDSVDARADVFALGVILKELSTDPQGSSADAHPGQALRRVIDRCTEPEAAWRYPDADALAEDLERVLAGESVALGRPGVLARLAFGARQRPLRAAAWLVAVVALALGLWWGAETRERNRRLQHAGRIQGAYHELQAGLEPLLLRAEGLRYADAQPGEPEALLAEVDGLVARARDESGVGEAYRCWIGWLAGEQEAQQRLSEARVRYPDNPFPHLVQAWVHLRRYTELAEWPGGDQGITLHRVRTPVQLLLPREIDAMRVELAAAGEALQTAHSARVWDQVSALAWVEDLCAGFEAYTRGDHTAAVRLLGTVGAHADLPVEANLVLAFAHCQLNDVQGAFEALEQLLAKRPAHRVALRALATCHRERAQRAITLGEDGRQDLRAAMQLTSDLSEDPEHDPTLAMLEFNLYFAEKRLGVQAGQTLERAWLAHERALAVHGENYRLLANRAQMRLERNTNNHNPRSELAAALTDLQAARDIRGDDYTIDLMELGVRLMDLKAARGSPGGVDDETIMNLSQRMDQALEHWGPDGQLYHYRASLAMLRISLLGSAEEATLPLYRSAVEDCRAALARDADFQESRFLLLWLSFFLPPELALADEEVLNLESELRAHAREGRLTSTWEHFLANGFTDYARRHSGQPVALAYASAGARARQWLVEDAPLDPVRRLDAGLSYLMLARHDAEGIKQHLERALEQLGTATQQDPERAEAWRWLAVCHSLLAETGGGVAHPVQACERLARECAESARQAGDESAVLDVVRLRAAMRAQGGPSGPEPFVLPANDDPLRDTLALLRSGAAWSLLQAELEPERHGAALELLEWLASIEGASPELARLVALGHHRLGHGIEALEACAAQPEDALLTLALRCHWTPETVARVDRMRLEQATDEQLGIVARALRDELAGKR